MVARFLPRAGGRVMAGSILTPILLFVLVGGIYIAVCMGLASGGWRNLHADYPASARPDGRQWRFASARIGSTFYQALRVVDADRGLYLSCPVLLFHRPVVIPWTAVTRERESQSRRDSGGLRLSVSTSRGPVVLTFVGALAKAIEVRLQLNREAES